MEYNEKNTNPHKKSGGIFWAGLLLGVAATILVIAFGWKPTFEKNVREEATRIALNDSTKWLARGDTAGYQRRDDEQKKKDYQVSWQKFEAEKRTKEQKALFARRKQSEPSGNYQVVKTDQGYVVGEPIPKE